jgi:hypothetical protein
LLKYFNYARIVYLLILHSLLPIDATEELRELRPSIDFCGLPAPIRAPPFCPFGGLPRRFGLSIESVGKEENPGGTESKPGGAITSKKKFYFGLQMHLNHYPNPLLRHH